MKEKLILVHGHLRGIPSGLHSHCMRRFVGHSSVSIGELIYKLITDAILRLLIDFHLPFQFEVGEIKERGRTYQRTGIESDGGLSGSPIHSPYFAGLQQRFKHSGHTGLRPRSSPTRLQVSTGQSSGLTNRHRPQISFRQQRTLPHLNLLYSSGKFIMATL